MDRNTFGARSPIRPDGYTTYSSYSSTHPEHVGDYYTSSISPRPYSYRTSYHETRDKGPVHEYVEYDSRTPDHCKQISPRRPLSSNSNTTTYSWSTNSSANSTSPRYETNVTNYESRPTLHSITSTRRPMAEFGADNYFDKHLELNLPEYHSSKNSHSHKSCKSSANGNVSIVEVCPEGNFIELENAHGRTDEDLGGWKLKQTVDGQLEVVYTIPQGTSLRPHQHLKIWGRKHATQAKVGEIVFEGAELFGVGSSVRTVLHNKDGDECATHVREGSQT